MTKKTCGIADDVIILKSYIYLDEAEINGLYNQLYPAIIEKLTKIDERSDHSRGGSFGGNLAMAKAETSFGTKAETNVTSEIKEIVPIERKTNEIISYVCNDLLRPLESIIDDDPMLGKSIIVGYAAFVVTYIYDENDNLIELTTLPYNGNIKKCTLILESGCTKNISDLKYIEHDSYQESYGLKGSKYAIEMNIGGGKMRREIRHLTYLVRNGKAFNFRFLGHISYLGGKSYSIKPFAIWN